MTIKRTCCPKKLNAYRIKKEWWFLPLIIYLTECCSYKLFKTINYWRGWEISLFSMSLPRMVGLSALSLPLLVCVEEGDFKVEILYKYSNQCGQIVMGKVFVLLFYLENSSRIYCFHPMTFLLSELINVFSFIKQVLKRKFLFPISGSVLLVICSLWWPQ